MHALPLMIGALCAAALGYRYYSAFIAARVLALDDARITPAHRLRDGHNYVPTNKWVLFGHHFAAITGAVHDFVILTASMRRDGKSLAEIARAEISPRSGVVAGFAVLFIVMIAIAAMAKVVVNALAESAWGTFTIGCSIPIALFMGLYMCVFRKGKIGEASAIGVVLLLAAVFFGKDVAASSAARFFLLTDHQLIVALGTYGFIASVLPVWLLLCPRDYLSSYMKLGTIALLIGGILAVNPELKAPAASAFTRGGPVVPGALWPFVFITIACGAISGFHGLIGSGTTPKMIDKESHARTIGYGAMLMEGIVGVVALIAASSLAPGDYFAINAPPDKFAALDLSMDHLPELSAQIGEKLQGRTGGAVSLAVGMSQIFSGLLGRSSFISYWYHFAIMFEALFILTTVDTGTRVARFLVQEFGGRLWAPFGRTSWLPGAFASTAIVCFGWGYLVWQGSIQTIWPMLGISNQLLACIALCAATTLIINRGKARYAWVTLVPMLFVSVATETAGYQLVTRTFIPKMIRSGKDELIVQGYLLATLCVLSMAALVFIFLDALARWTGVRPGSPQRAEPLPSTIV